MIFKIGIRQRMLATMLAIVVQSTIFHALSPDAAASSAPKDLNADATEVHT